MIQFWTSIKPIAYQRLFVKSTSLNNPVRRNLSVLNFTKVSFSVKAKVAVGVVSISGCVGYNYIDGYKIIRNLIPVAHCESIRTIDNREIKSSNYYSKSNHTETFKEKDENDCRYR